MIEASSTKFSRISSAQRRLGRFAALLLAGPAFLPAVAHAQAAPAEAPAADEATDPIAGTEDIVVTARKRSETVQSIPATINVVSQASLEASGASSLLQLESVAPGINIAKASTGNEIGVTIRGLGSQPGEPSFDSSVGLFIDGVYAPRSREFAASMFDLQRIEVIRGTQAALLGKNTSLGAISLVTRKPGDTFAVDARASYEFDQGSTVFSGGVDVPLGETLRVRVSGQATDDNGFVRNSITGDDSPRTVDRAIRGVAVWQPTPTLEITGLVQHDVSKNYGSPVEFVSSTGIPELLGALAGYPGAVETSLDRRNALTVNGGEQNERLVVDRYALTVNLDLGEHRLTSVSAYSRYTNGGLADIDGVPGDYAYRTTDETSEQFSQELRIVSPTGRALTYVLGGLFLDSDLKDNTFLATDYPFGPAPGVLINGSFRNRFHQYGHTVSLFGQADYMLVDGLKVTGGLRWTREKKQADLSREIVVPGLTSVVLFPPYAPFSLERTESNLDYSFGAQYSLNSDVLFYASYGQGTKSGGFAQSVTLLDQSPYAKEVAKTLEAGVKFQDAGHTWTLNLAAFQTHVDDYQLVTFNGLQFLVTNTDLSNRGVELEASWRPMRGLRLNFNTTYSDAKDRNTNQPIPLAPRWSGSAGFDFRSEPIGGLVLKADGAIDVRGKRYYQQDPNASAPGNTFTPVSFGIAVGASDDRWEARLIGRNLLDETEAAFSFPTPLLPPGNGNAIAERGRTVALQVSVKF